MLDFVEQGGLVIAPKYWGPSGLAPYREFRLIHYDFYRIGKGRFVAAAHGFSDPFTLAHDAHQIVGIEHEPFLLFSPSTATCYGSADPVGHTEIVQILNYNTPRQAEFVSLWVKGSVRTANLVSQDGLNPLECVPESDGIRIAIPPVDVYCAVEIEREAS